MTSTILIVEDEPGISENIHYALSTEGYHPLCCTTGKAALELLRSNTIDLIILDIGLPDVSGFDLCKEIRKVSQVPIIFLTARHQEVDRVVGLEIGADDYIVKPFSPRELTARVKAILRRSKNSSQEKTPAKKQHQVPFSLDEERLIISYFGTPLDLSRYEFRLLSVLLKRPGRVYSREELMNLAWKEPEMSLERTIDTHIKTIRGKLRSVRKDIDPIVTHRGYGYSLREDW